MHGMALPGRTVGLTLSVGCFYVIALVCFALVQIVTLGSKESWWEMCETVPCNSRSQPAIHSQLNSCPATAFHPDADPNVDVALAEIGFEFDLTGVCKRGESSKACNQHKCELLKERVMMLDSGEESVACLRQFRLPNGEWSSFGAVCCTVCDYGQMGDTDAVFRSWSTKRQACGLFNCKQDGHDPHNDFCPDRREYARVAQAFTVVSVIFVAFLAAFHFSELFSLTRDVNRRVPLPHAMKELRDWVRMYAHYAHYLTGVLLLFAAVFATITLSKEFCGVRLASYVHARFGVRILWGGACMVTVFGCYYHLALLGFYGVSRLYLDAQVRAEARAGLAVASAAPIGAMGATSEEATRASNSMSPLSPEREEEVPPIELRAVVLSPTDGRDDDVALEMSDQEGDDDPAPAPTAASAGAAETAPPPAVQGAQMAPPPSLTFANEM
eukprot:Rhum_TRINITY_DN24923_c0_g1::Rhum_TRINITY_DN24923_c0_g1_i1::g.180626::m.180626